MNSITLCLNMTKVNSKEVRAKMDEAGIVPQHLQLKWLHLNIHEKGANTRWSTVAERSYHSYNTTIIVDPEQFIDVFSFLFLQPTLQTFQYIEILKLTNKQIADLRRSVSWKTWLENQYLPAQEQNK